MVDRTSASVSLPSCQANIDLEPTTRAKPAYAARMPGSGQRGQQVDRPGVALQQHLGDARSGPEIAVDLKGRVRVKEIGVGAAAVVLGAIAAGKPQLVVEHESARDRRPAGAPKS